MPHSRFLLPALALIGAGALAASAAAQTTAKPDKPDPVTGAVQQPFKDLNLMKDPIPPVLIRAAEAPYVETQPRDCAALRAELGELEQILGPDLDAAKSGDSDLISQTLRSVTNIPFRGVVRKLTGAEKRERIRQRAVFAGVARRGFLKGVVRSSCDAPPPAVASAPTTIAAEGQAPTPQ